MSKEIIQTYWKPSFDTLYEAYFQELSSEALIGRWQRIDLSIAFLVATTASGSTIAGWILWSEPNWKSVWAIIAGIVSIAAIAHGVLGVPGRVKEQEELRREFCELRIDLETFRQQLNIDIDANQAYSQYTKLRERYSQIMGRAHPDNIAFRSGFRDEVQEKLNNILKEKVYI